MKETNPTTLDTEVPHLPLLIELLHNNPTLFWQEALKTHSRQEILNELAEQAKVQSHNLPIDISL
jgi:hypothetical protein